ncbi:MAG: ATP-binding cassette domain-containing protein [Spiroplasma sp.]|nr:ATP-binding cassette domain-containing protein [Mycoplasmatales bacterium]
MDSPKESISENVQDVSISNGTPSINQEIKTPSIISVNDILGIIGVDEENTIKSVFDETFSHYQTQNLNINGKPIIEFSNVHLSIDKQKVLNGISIKIHEGDFVYLVGPSGAGKSCLAKLIYRDLNVKEGEITVNNRSITNLKPRDLPKLRREVGVVFQDYKLLNNKTVFQNVLYSLEVTGYPKKKRIEQVLKTLKMVNILENKDKYPNELSGGQQQRVAIARALVDEPSLIVADEPTGNLDPQNATIIMEILNQINAAGTTIVMATHDVNIVNKYQKRVILIKDGKVANESEGEYIYE